MVLQPVPAEQVRRAAGLPPSKEFKTTFPKRGVRGASEARAAFKRWQGEQPAPPAVSNPDEPVKAVRPTRASIAKLRAVAESEVAPAALLEQKLPPEGLFGTIYSALTTYEFMRMQAEYKRRRGALRASARVDAQWEEVVRAASTAYAVAGLPDVGQRELDGFVRELVASRANLSAVVRLAESAVTVDKGTALTASTKVVAAFLPVVERYFDPSILVTPILDLCDKPIAQGSFTKHFSRSISLSVKIKYWCPTWTDPFRTCTKTITLAGVSFSIGFDVGYKVTCCGATAWGVGYAEACATIVGIKVCASCSASVTGVAGVSRAPTSTGCSYGLGINAVLQCKFAGATILYLSVPFGWTVTGPCPPAGLCP